MNFLSITSIIQVALTLLGGLLAALTKSGAPANILTGIQNAISELNTVHGTIVTKSQVDGLLVEPRW